MDQIIGGTAYSTQDGAVLAALAAWHLYPDIVVLGSNTVDVRQHDELIHPGGVLTIGLQTDSKERIKGLSWSLSLAHLRYYGYPVLKEQTLGSDASRLTIEELLQVALGCVLGSWKVDIADLVVGASTLSLLCECVATGIPKPESSHDQLRTSTTVPEPDQTSWVSMLGRSAKRFLSSDSEKRSSYRRPILLGLRNVNLTNLSTELLTEILSYSVQEWSQNLLSDLEWSDSAYLDLKRYQDVCGTYSTTYFTKSQAINLSGRP